MRLADLEPTFISDPDGNRIGVGFLCPACREQGLYIPTADPESSTNWSVSGDLENLTLQPSVDSRHVNGGVGTDKPRVECHWHGWVRNGIVEDA